MRPTEKGKHWGLVTAKAFEVLKALLWCFHNVVSGKCFPSYETIAAAAGVARSTVDEAMLTAAFVRRCRCSMSRRRPKPSRCQPAP